MKLKFTFVALALASGVMNAMAANYAIGSLPIAPTIYSNVPSVAQGDFSDLYSFLFPAGACTASGSAVTIDAAALLNISNRAYPVVSHRCAQAGLPAHRQPW